MKVMKRKTVWTTVLICAFLMCVLPARNGACAERKVIKLRVAAGHPYPAAAWVKVLQDFFVKEVEKRVQEQTSDYKVECKGYYGGSLVKLGEVLEGVQNGVADIGLVNNIFELSKLEPHNFCWWIPFGSPNPKQVMNACTKVMEQFPLFDKIFAKYNQRQIGRAYNSLLSFELVTNFPVKTMEGLKGRKIAHGGPMIPWLKVLGAVGVQSTFSDAYTAIDTGVYDGWAMPPDVATNFKIYEVARYTTIVGFGASVAGFLTINLNTWKRLPPKVQAILNEVGNEYSWKLYELNMKNSADALKTMKKHGSTIYTLPQEERKRWGKVLSVAGVAAATAKKAEAHGYPGRKILKAYVDALEKEEYTFPFPPNL